MGVATALMRGRPIARATTNNQPEDANNMAKQTLMMVVYKRLTSEGRWAEAEPVRNELARQAKDRGLKGIAAQDWTYEELARRFPPQDGSKPETEPVEEPPNEEKPGKPKKGKAEVGNVASFATPVDVSPKPSRDDEFSVSGLSNIPANWGEMPANAQLSAEVSWVQANRLRVVREGADRVVVDLSKALSPAPSYATLGWLETSIKTYTKFVDVASKATAGLDGEAADVRREVQSIAEVRRILAEMFEN
jgi:hypothetical protein